MQRQICVGCNASPPDMGKGMTTLASPREGWRLSRVKADDGSDSVAWRCPKCWKKYKADRPSKAHIPARGRASSD